MSRYGFVGGLTVAFMLAAVGAWAAPVYVALSGDGSTGASWGTAYTNIQTAINNVNATNGVWIKADTYAITNPIVMANNVALYGGFAGTETSLAQRNWRANVTIITNTVAADATYPTKRVIQCDARNNWRLDGLQIVGGSLYSAGFSSADANRGAGVSLNLSGGNNVIANCYIGHNRGLGAAGGYSVGLGMNLGSDATILIENTIVDDNVSPSINGHAQLANGLRTTVIFRNCVFRRGQSAGAYGSGITKSVCDANLRIENCVFINNGKPGADRTQALEVVGPGGGTTIVYNCSFVDHANSGAPTISELTADANLELYNNHFYGNSMIYSNDGTTAINSIAALNALPEAEGNVAGDPRFLDKASLDFRFPAESPCADAGTNYMGLAPAADYYGNARPTDIPGVGATGGSGHDIGIYELPSGIAHAIHVALAGNGSAGTNWATAYTNIQAAINDPKTAVLDIWIKGDVFAITNQITMSNNVSLYGGFAGTETMRTQRNWRVNATIITNTVDATSAYSIKRVIQCDTRSNWRLDGLHLTGGSLWTNGFQSSSVNQGAGVNACGSSGSNVIANCRIYGNRGLGGSGAYSAGLGLNNLAAGTTLLVENTIFDSNSGSLNGHAHVLGGTPSTSVIFRNCVFRRGQCGGNYVSGVAKNGDAQLRIEHCVFIENGRPAGDRAQAFEAAGPGGGTTYVYNCSFVDHTNSASPTVAESTADANLELYHNHFYNNSLIYRDIVPGATNSINTIADLNLLPEAEGCVGGNPGFTDKANFDFRFRGNSPCVDTGTNLFGWAPRVDYYGNPRPVDFAAAGAEMTGNEYDIGVYELPLPPGTVFTIR